MTLQVQQTPSVSAGVLKANRSRGRGGGGGGGGWDKFAMRAAVSLASTQAGSGQIAVEKPVHALLQNELHLHMHVELGRCCYPYQHPYGISVSLPHEA